ncbi:hypothetical protein [Kitasatospora sp. NPDC093806]|uniref:hypothetical protein n=1 Tax=Kitasatospora sp. NPDC093806 TaxID=3155075 RepID=UPI00341BD3A4
MHRRRTAATAAVAGVLLAVPGLAGCGNDGLTAGTAAVLDGRRIPVDAVADRVAALRQAPGGASADAWQEASRGADGPVRRAVADLVLDAVVARAVAERGPAVGPAEVAAARAEEEQRYGGAERLARALAARGVPGGAIDDYVRRRLGIRRLAAAAGLDADSPAGDAAVRFALASTATTLHLRVNPRYGTWDPDHATLTPTTHPWLAG